MDARDAALLIAATALDQAYSALNEVLAEVEGEGGKLSRQTAARARALLPAGHTMSFLQFAPNVLLSEPHQRRVLAEWLSCEKRLAALEAFTEGPVFAVLPKVERLLLADQKDAMQDYAHALAERLRLWGLDVEELRQEMLGA